MFQGVYSTKCRRVSRPIPRNKATSLGEHMPGPRVFSGRAVEGVPRGTYRAVLQSPAQLYQG